MDSFRTLFEDTHSLLVANAAGLGVSSSNILQGEPGKDMPTTMPFIYLYCLPSTEAVRNDNLPSGYALATLHISCGVALETTSSEALKKAMELAGRVITVLAQSTYSIRFSTNSIYTPVVNAPFAQTVVTVTAPYTPWESLLP